MNSWVLPSLLLLSVAIVAIQASAIDCSLVLCARPLCANPVTPPGECCPSCKDSNCNFTGCVNFNDKFGPQWQPNPCKFCQCDKERNEPICAVSRCSIPPTREDCFGFPVVTKPWECCSSCDFGKPETGCFVVPQVFSKRNITVSQSIGRNQCSAEVNDHTCDKFGFRFRGKKFRCDPVQGRRLVRFGKTCPLAWGVRKDTVRCRAVRDNSINVGCDLIVKG